ncbi:Tip elongation aberrant protein [Yarrowia sp. B02]|nr:Tip elongation aberrant protein [Yarrowia sp. B02]
MVAPLKIDTTREMEIYSRDDKDEGAQSSANSHVVGDEDDEEDLDDDPFEHQSSSPSIHEDEIDFDYVYAFKTFVATEKGQANAVKGDAMVLLNDSNSYWWLVRLVKDSSVGFLPAEHVETPWERLARLNKHRNGELASPAGDSHGFSSFFGEKKEGSNPFNKIFKKKDKAKSVAFNGNPTYVSASEYEYSDGYEGEEDDDTHDEHEHEEDEADEEHDYEDEEDTERVVRHLQTNKPGQINPLVANQAQHHAPQPVLSPDLDKAPTPLVVNKVRKAPANLTVDTSLRPGGAPNVIVQNNPNHPNAQVHSSWDANASSEEEEEPRREVGEESVIITSQRPVNASAAAAAAGVAGAAMAKAGMDRSVSGDSRQRAPSAGSVASSILPPPSDHRLSVSSQNSDSSAVSQSSGKKRFSLLRAKSSVDNLQRSSSGEKPAGRFAGLFKRKSKEQIKKNSKDLEPVRSPASSVHSASSSVHQVADQSDLASIDEEGTSTNGTNGVFPVAKPGSHRKGSYSSVSSVRSQGSLLSQQSSQSPMQARHAGPATSVAPLAPRPNRPMSQPVVQAPVGLQLHHSHSVGSSPAMSVGSSPATPQHPGHPHHGPNHHPHHPQKSHMPGQAPGHSSLGPMPSYAPGMHEQVVRGNGHIPGQAPGHASLGPMPSHPPGQFPHFPGQARGHSSMGSFPNGHGPSGPSGPNSHGPNGPDGHGPNGPNGAHRSDMYSRDLPHSIDDVSGPPGSHPSGFPERRDSRQTEAHHHHHPLAHPDLPRALSPERQVGRMTPEERPLHIARPQGRSQTPTGPQGAPFADLSPLKTFNREYGSSSTLGSSQGLPPVSPIKTVNSGRVTPTSQIPTPSQASFHNERGEEVEEGSIRETSPMESITSPSSITSPMESDPFGVHDPRTNTAAPPWPSAIDTTTSEGFSNHHHSLGDDVEIESIGSDLSSHEDAHLHPGLPTKEQTPSVVSIVSSFDDELETPTVAVAKHMSLTPQLAGFEASEFAGRSTPDASDARTPQLESHEEDIGDVTPQVGSHGSVLGDDADVGNSTLTRAPVAHLGAPSAPTPVAPLAHHRIQPGNVSTQSVQSFATAHNGFSSASLASSFSTSSLLDGYEQRSEETVDESPVSEMAEASGFGENKSDASSSTIRRIPAGKSKRYSTTLHPDIANVYKGTNDRLDTLNDKVDMLLRHLS